MNQITVTAMVLAVSPVGEYDRRVVLLTKERGKLAAFARGARRQGSALLGVTSPFSFGEFTLYEGRTSYTLMSASVSNYFEELRTDVEGAYYGFYFMDLASYYAREAADERELLKLLYQSLRALTNLHIPNRLVRCIFELRTIVIEGEGPQLGECVLCGNEAGERLFSVRKGGLVCRQCEGRAGDARPLLGSTVYAMQYIAATPLEKLYTFVVKEEVLEELEQVTGAYLEAYVGRHFKSLDILETVIGTDRRFKEDLT
ncbi:DNA repair protein RecO [Massilistercora timonensis]|uniref:DNA repair protein RecO n=1 Tax=Massilistercora timonensis TaxID=2086584 RepID=UPI00320B1FC0